MKRSTILWLIFLPVVFTIIMQWHRSAEAQSRQIEESSTVRINELEEAIQILENPEESKNLAYRLRAVLKAKEQLREEKKEEKGEKERPEIIDIGLVKVYKSYKNKITSAYEKISTEIRSIPLSYRGFKDYIYKEENRQQLFSFFLKTLVAFLVGFLVFLGFRRYTGKLEEKLRGEEPFSLSRKIASVFINTSFKTYPWIGLYLFCYLFLLFFPLHEKAETILLTGLLAFIFYFILRNLVFFLLSPENRESRVIPLRDELSNYIFIWWRRVLLFSLWMYLLMMISSNINRPALMKAFSGIYKVGLVVLLAIMLAQWKENIENALFMTIKTDEPDWKKNLKVVFNNLRGKIYLVAILYIGLMFLMSILGYAQIYTFLLYGTIRSAITVLIAAGLWFLWDFLYKRLFEIGNTIKARFPELEEKVNRYIGFIRKAVFAIIIIFAILALLDIWGLRIYQFITSSPTLMQVLVRIPLIIIMSLIAVQVINYIIGKLEKQTLRSMLTSPKTSSVEAEKRVSTLGGLFRKAALVTVIVITAMMVFAELGFDIKPILAGAGIVGLAVGFGAQNMVRDIISGLFLTFENRVRVGDVAVINGTGGLVEQVNLRTTVLRSLDGAVHVFPNGAINTLSNLTHGFSFYVFDVGVAYKEDVDKVIGVLKEVGQEIMQDANYNTEILEPLEILGVDKFADSAVVIKARIKTSPIKQWFVGREMNRRIKKRFDELGIEIPFPHRTFYFGEESKAIRVKLDGLREHREEFKELIHEVLQERDRNTF